MTTTELYKYPLRGAVIGCAIEVHRHLGPGLLESTYEQCLAHELHLAKVPCKIQAPLPDQKARPLISVSSGLRGKFLPQTREKENIAKSDEERSL